MEKQIDGILFEMVDQEEPMITKCCEGCYFINIVHCIEITDGQCTLDENINKVWQLKE